MTKLLRRLWVPAALLGVASAVAACATTDGFASFGSAATGARAERMQHSPRYHDGVFVNEGPRPPTTSFLKAMGAKGSAPSEDRAPHCPLPLYGRTAEVLATPPASGLRITWLGHSTTLIELDGKRVLTDPQWSERASPSTAVGPQRFHPPPLPFDQLPQVDAVLISHDHYDHLDMETARALAKRGAVFHLGLGVGAHLEKWGIPAAQIQEHDWWEEVDLGGGVKVVSTPAQHFSGRGLSNRNSTLWTSWAVIGPAHRVYFSGDTGLGEFFATIGQKLGPFDVGMFEVGQFNDAWGDIHLGPHGALTAHVRLGAERFFPIHWSTFQLGLHGWSEPAEQVVTEAAQRSIKAVTPMLGEPIEPTTVNAPTPWWRALPPMAAKCP